jgi:hypothetical protein
MLFRTVYGPELEAIYGYVTERNAQGIHPQKAEIYAAFIPRQSDGSFPPTQNVDDALAFLKSARMIRETDGYYTCESMPGVSFAVQVLRMMRCIEKGKEPPDHSVDLLYSLLLTELFIKPDLLFVLNLHAAANQLHPVQAVGGLSKEKIQTWKRVMEFLGVGRRVAGGFLCAYSPSLMATILAQWSSSQGTLQSFLEDCFDQVLPCTRSDGDLPQAVIAPLTYLADQGQIELFPLQDSPTRPYFGHHRYRGIAWRREND